MIESQIKNFFDRFTDIFDLLDVSGDALSLSVSLKKMDSQLIRIEPNIGDSNGNTINTFYTVTTETSFTE